MRVYYTDKTVKKSFLSVIPFQCNAVSEIHKLFQCTTGNNLVIKDSSKILKCFYYSEGDKISSLPFFYVKLHFYTSTILYSCHFVVYLCQSNFFCVSVIFAVSSDLFYASNKSLFHT